MTIDVSTFSCPTPLQWCPGCPNHLILLTLKEALVECGKKPHEVCLVSGIGQAAKLPHYLRSHFFNGLHGRALPVATAIATVQPDLSVIVTTGEGDCYGEGGNHFLHTLRRNPNLSLFVHNNAIYALTKGQSSPTTPAGERRSLHPSGVIQPPLNPLGIAILHRAAFVARGFALDREQLRSLMVEAIRTRGFSYVDIVQPCITWDPRPLSWFREHLVPVDERHDPTDMERALALTMAHTPKMLTGVLFRGPERPIFGEEFYREAEVSSLSNLPPPPPSAVEEVLSAFLPPR